MSKEEMLAQLSHEDYRIAPGQSYVIDRFRPEDALGVARCFYAVYGSAYSKPTVYSPGSLIEENAAGRLYSVIARTPTGDVVGHCALFCSPTCTRLYEAGQLLVLPEYRNETIAKQIVSYGLETLPQHLSVEELFGKAVCNHSISQRLGASFDFIETAFEIDYIPEDAYQKEQSASGPVSALLMFRCYQDRPHELFLPDWYEEALRQVYAGLPIKREFTAARTCFPSQSRSQVQQHFFGGTQVARLFVADSGADFADRLAAFEGQAASNGSDVMQVYVNLGNSSVGWATGLLNAKGYFLGGALPRWFNQDGLLLQKTQNKPHFSDIAVYSRRAAQLLDFIQKDWAAVST